MFKKTISVLVWFLIEEDVNLLMHIYLIILTGRLMNEFLQNGFFPENWILGKSLRIKKEWAQKFFDILSFETMAGQNRFSIKVIGIGVSIWVLKKTILYWVTLKKVSKSVSIWVNQYLPSTILNLSKTSFKRDFFCHKNMLESDIFYR